MSHVLRIATRKSQLALWQANHVSQIIAKAHPGLSIELLPMSTSGDRQQDTSLAQHGGKGRRLSQRRRRSKQTRCFWRSA